MLARWFALSALTALLVLAPDAQAGAGNTGASVESSRAQDFSARGKYAKKQTDTYQRTKKYR